ncbi:hypothetical protein K1W54_22170 [Micromonospora sp. CPCC 205371]|nr:hypothetical protein [Micromonospora sp. CPCC 205371]
MDVVSTAAVSPGERFAFWRAVHKKLWAPYDLQCDPRWENGFEAEVGISYFGPMQATLMTTMPHSIHRTPKLVRQSDPEVFILGCTVRGGGLIMRDGQCAEVGAGDLLLYDPSRPFLAELTPGVAVHRMLLLRFPRSLLPLPARDLRGLGAGRIPGTCGIGALSSQFLLQLARHMHELSPSDASPAGSVNAGWSSAVVSTSRVKVDSRAAGRSVAQPRRRADPHVSDPRSLRRRRPVSAPGHREHGVRDGAAAGHRRAAPGRGRRPGRGPPHTARRSRPRSSPSRGPHAARARRSRRLPRRRPQAARGGQGAPTARRHSRPHPPRQPMAAMARLWGTPAVAPPSDNKVVNVHR